MPGIILQLNAVAQQAGIGFTSISPAESTPATGYQVRKIDLAFTGASTASPTSSTGCATSSASTAAS